MCKSIVFFGVLLSSVVFATYACILHSQLSIALQHGYRPFTVSDTSTSHLLDTLRTSEQELKERSCDVILVQKMDDEFSVMLLDTAEDRALTFFVNAETGSQCLEGVKNLYEGYKIPDARLKDKIHYLWEMRALRMKCAITQTSRKHV